MASLHHFEATIRQWLGKLKKSFQCNVCCVCELQYMCVRCRKKTMCMFKQGGELTRSLLYSSSVCCSLMEGDESWSSDEFWSGAATGCSSQIALLRIPAIFSTKKNITINAYSAGLYENSRTLTRRN